jgi:hypothetical protein
VSFIFDCIFTPFSQLLHFQVQQGHLSCTYLGLPLRLGRLKREDEQVLVDRLAGKLPSWKGRLLNKSVRLTLANWVISSIVVYHMIVFTLSKWAIKKIDRIQRNFLWQGSENARGGHCLVNWKHVQWPKKLGGLGVLELDHFNKALRLRWPWLQ